jgi:N-ethylmaleimide reductase
MDLLSKYRLGSLELTSRVVMAPMTRCRAIGSVPNELMRDYYVQRASAGLIITEGTSTSPSALGYARIPGLYSAEQIKGWRRITSAVQEAGGRIFVQLMHTGRIGHPHNLGPGARLIAPSAVASSGQMWTDQAGMQPLPTPEEMTAADIRETRDELIQVSKNAIEAGFDGVEFHAANGYLLEQFIHPHSNRRTDAYGGSIEKRISFVTEVVGATAEAIGAERTGIRLSPYGTFNDLPHHGEVHATYEALARKLRDLVYVHIVKHTHADFPQTAEAIRSIYGGTIILNGGFDPASAQQALDENEADLISFGKWFVSNPDLVQRLKRRSALNDPKTETFYTAGAEGYVDYPALSA